MAVGANPCGRPLPVLMYSKHIENWYYYKKLHKYRLKSSK